MITAVSANCFILRTVFFKQIRRRIVNHLEETEYIEIMYLSGINRGHLLYDLLKARQGAFDIWQLSRVLTNCRSPFVHVTPELACNCAASLFILASEFLKMTHEDFPVKKTFSPFSICYFGRNEFLHIYLFVVYMSRTKKSPALFDLICPSQSLRNRV